MPGQQGLGLVAAAAFPPWQESQGQEQLADAAERGKEALQAP
ncbi:hypothetical protein [Paenibacillus humicus]|nr:hypothetical protein [Paenibacillus humicus]